MLELMRAMARYGYFVILFLGVVLLQLVVGCVAVSGVIGSSNPTAQVVVSFVTPNPAEKIFTPVPAATSTPTSTPTPTFTPSPTRTPLPSSTPTLTPTSTPLPSSTPMPVDTSTPTPQPTPTVQGFTLTVPILMYHYLSEPPPGADAIRRDLSVSPAQFEAHLAYLRQAGYETISFEQLIFALTQQSTLPEKPVIITFDDGYRDNYENAFPLLRKYSYTATFFIFNRPIDANSADYLTWEMVIEMHKAGMEFGSHSYSHPDLRNRDVDFLVYQILGSKEAIEERTGEPTRFFAYPSGQYDDLTIKVLESANFWAAVTTEWGAEQSYANRFEMPRIRVRGNDTVKELAEKLEFFKN